MGSPRYTEGYAGDCWLEEYDAAALTTRRSPKTFWQVYRAGSDRHPLTLDYSVLSTWPAGGGARWLEEME